jgi:L-seryl-tRNA(Ser) seleniumtransferase
MRALRVDKLTLSALSATLAIYLYSDDPLQGFPHLRMIAEPAESVKRRTQRLKKLVGARPGTEISIVPSSAAVGGGSCPGLQIPSWALRIRPRQHSARKLAAILRRANPPVIATVSEEAVDLDMRTILPEETRTLANVLRSVVV